MSIYDQNRRAWDALVRRGERHTRPANDADFVNPLAAVDGNGWLGPSIAGWRVLCLAAGGGRQSALFAAAGAVVTVVDLSPEMLALDRQVAEERKLAVRTIEASMDDLGMLADSEFRSRRAAGEHLLRARFRGGLSPGGTGHAAGRTLCQPAQAAGELASGGATIGPRLSVVGALLSQRAIAGK